MKMLNYKFKSIETAKMHDQGMLMLSAFFWMCVAVKTPDSFWFFMPVATLYAILWTVGFARLAKVRRGQCFGSYTPLIWLPLACLISLMLGRWHWWFNPLPTEEIAGWMEEQKLDFYRLSLMLCTLAVHIYALAYLEAFHPEHHRLPKDFSQPKEQI